MRRLTATGLAAATALVATAAASAAPVQGSISGPITAVKGSTFTVKTTLSPTGSSKVTVGSKATVTEQKTGTAADLKKGTCVTAMGTKAKTTVAAQRISLRPAVKGSCTGGFGRGGRPGSGGTRPPGSGSGSGSGSGGGSGRGGGSGFTPPANFGFASGQITAVKGSTLTVKGFNGTTTVTVSGKTAITKTVDVGASAIAEKMCAFVFGTSSDKGKTVTAQTVSLTEPVSGSCTSGFRRGGGGTTP